MTPQQFIEKFREAFGEATPLPIAFWYGNTAVNAENRVPRCMIGAIRKVCEGNELTLTPKMCSAEVEDFTPHFTRCPSEYRFLYQKQSITNRHPSRFEPMSRASKSNRPTSPTSTLCVSIGSQAGRGSRRLYSSPHPM